MICSVRADGSSIYLGELQLEDLYPGLMIKSRTGLLLMFLNWTDELSTVARFADMNANLHFHDITFLDDWRIVDEYANE